MPSTNCLGIFLTGKAMTKFLLLCTTFLIMSNGLIITESFYFATQLKLLKLDFIFNKFNITILEIYPMTSYLFIVAGIFGILALINGTSKFLGIYATVLFFGFILNVTLSGTIISNALYGLITLQDKFVENMMEYDINLEANTFIDDIQKNAKCCGYLGPTQWDENFRMSSNLDFDDTELYTLPNSCCIDERNGKCSSYYYSGCNTALQLDLMNVILYVLLVSSGLSVLLLLSYIIARRAAKKCDKNEIVPVYKTEPLRPF